MRLGGHLLASLSYKSLQLFRSFPRYCRMSTTAPPIFPRTPKALAIQSYTVHGYVGNKAASFPLQCLGFDVDAINTVELSNHPGYANGFTGKMEDVSNVTEFLDGLEKNNLLDYDVVLSGYTRSVDVIGQIEAAVRRVKAARSDAMYVCDPVLGDNGKFYVPMELLDAYVDRLLPLADVLCPNQFEAEMLSKMPPNSIQSDAVAIEACSRLHSRGVRLCLLKGLRFANRGHSLSMVLSHKDIHSDKQNVLRIDCDMLPASFSGCGDLCSALIAGWLHHPTTRTMTLSGILEKVAHDLHAVLEITHLRASKELCIVESRETFRFLPEYIPKFRSYRIKGDVLGVIFDMDGTLTEPGAIDFDAMYRRCKFSRVNGDILTQINALPDPDMQSSAHEIIIDEELKGCQRMVLRPDLLDTLRKLSQNRLRTAISTRNCRRACDIFLQRLTDELPSSRQHTFNPVLTRESLGGINKPNPEVALHILKDIHWGVDDPSLIWFVGDSEDDIRCGKGAGCKTCLIITDYNKSFLEKHPELVDLAVESLSEFTRYILGD